MDGTWNRAGTPDPTNVRKLFEATRKGNCQSGRLQIKLYVPGVGSRPKLDLGENGDAFNRGGNSEGRVVAT